MEFKVVNTPRHDRFESTITDLLNDGWELHGSPFVSQTGGMTQALFRNTPPPKDVKAKTNASKKDVS